jgi:hypothetical protein
MHFYNSLVTYSEWNFIYALRRKKDTRCPAVVICYHFLLIFELSIFAHSNYKVFARNRFSVHILHFNLKQTKRNYYMNTEIIYWIKRKLSTATEQPHNDIYPLLTEYISCYVFVHLKFKGFQNIKKLSTVKNLVRQHGCADWFRTNLVAQMYIPRFHQVKGKIFKFSKKEHRNTRLSDLYEGAQPPIINQIAECFDVFSLFCIIIKHKNTSPVVTIWHPRKQ